MKGNEFDLKSHIDRAVSVFMKYSVCGFGGGPLSVKSHYDTDTGDYRININFETNTKTLTVKQVSDESVTISIKDHNTKNFKVMLLSTVFGDIGYNIYNVMLESFDAINTEYIIYNAQCKLRYDRLGAEHSVMMVDDNAYHIVTYPSEVYVTNIGNGKNPTTVWFDGNKHDVLDMISFMHMGEFVTSVLNRAVKMPGTNLTVTTDTSNYVLTIAIRHSDHVDALTITVKRSDEYPKDYLFNSVFKDTTVSQGGNSVILPISQMVLDTIRDTFGLHHVL